ncbi:MAG: tyrosine-type recombinase/integrase [Cyclobacteriaceae bacterium]|nr:tyrosine-type recombinase/integrase [Cyclobacteriaceae bacterium]
MSFKQSDYYTTAQRAIEQVPGFRSAWQKFIKHTILFQRSESLAMNYGRNIAQIALHFGKVPHHVEIEDIKTYLYNKAVHERKSEGYFRQTVYGLRYWYRLFDQEANAIQLPPIRKKKSLPAVLSRQECRALFKAPPLLKHRFLLAFGYSSGLRMNELRMLKCADVDVDRMQIHVRMGKCNRDRYVPLSRIIADKLPLYHREFQIQTYLFEGKTPGQPMGRRSIAYIIAQALAKTNIVKKVSMHTLRHSYATHLLEDGVDIYSIQRLLGHSDIQNTITYLHIARLRPLPGHSPLDTLYGRIPSCDCGQGA